MFKKEIYNCPVRKVSLSSHGLDNKPLSIRAYIFIAMYIYIVTHPSFKGWIKLGQTHNPNRRLNIYQTNCPDRAFKLEFSIETALHSEIERYFKRDFNNYESEWYNCSVEFAVKKIKSFIENHNKAKTEAERLMDEECKLLPFTKNVFVKYLYIVNNSTVFYNMDDLSSYTKIKSHILYSKFCNFGNFIEIEDITILRQKKHKTLFLPKAQKGLKI